MSAERRAQWLRGVVDLCVLAHLERGRSYGYEIIRALQAKGLGAVPGGTLYPALARLARSELVRTTWDDSDAGPPRKYYELTALGGEVLRQEREDWAAFALCVQQALRAEAPR